MDNKLEKFLNSDNCYFIHYASDGFYNGSSPAPRVSCIVLYNNKTDESLDFSISDYLDDDTDDVKSAEAKLLDDFNRFVKNQPEIYLVHWNMTAASFGFKAIQARANDLCVEIPTLPEENLFDLSAYVAYIAEKKLSIKQILWFNSLLIGDDYLDGKTEAEYFNKGRYQDIFYSVDLKVRGFADVVKLISENKLKTEPPYRNNDGLTREERHREVVKRSQMREKMIKDIMEHNERVMSEQEIVYEDCEAAIFDPAHPVLSMFCNWFANWN